MNIIEKYYSPEMYAELARLEAGYWWFRARNRLLLWVLTSKILPFRTFLEVGCGTGFVLQAIGEAFRSCELYGSEYFEAGLSFARERVPYATFCQMDATEMDESDAYDAIGVFDVIEHIEKDLEVLINLSRALKGGGYLVITVPQHPFLWSEVDEKAYHVRRYTRSELLHKTTAAGLKVEYVTSFVSLALPLLWLSRLRARDKKYDPMSEFLLPAWQNRLLEAVMGLELGLLKLGLQFPVGGSLLLVGRKE